MNASDMKLGMSANFITKCRRKECGDIDILYERFGYKLDFCCTQYFFELSYLVPFRSVVVKIGLLNRGGKFTCCARSFPA
jgi:hypothetical protein